MWSIKSKNKYYKCNLNTKDPYKYIEEKLSNTKNIEEIEIFNNYKRLKTNRIQADYYKATRIKGKLSNTAQLSIFMAKDIIEIIKKKKNNRCSMP